MTDESDLDDERRFADGIKRLGDVDPVVLDRLSASVTALPARSRWRHIAPPSGPHRSTTVAALVAVAALIAAGGLWLTGAGLVGPSASGVPTGGASTPPSAPPDLSPGQYANDPRMVACEKSDNLPVGGRHLADVLYAWELSHGRDYRANLIVPVQPMLASASESALVVVFRTGDSLSSSGGNPPLIFTPPPGSHTVCVGPSGTGEPTLILNLAESNLVLPPASAAIGVTAGVAVASNRALSAMAWDSSRNSLWVVTWKSGPDGQLTRVDADGTTKTWTVPNGPSMQILPAIQAGLQQPAMPAAWYGWDATDLVVDSQGEVWIAAGYGLVRFDPATGRSQLRAFPESDMTQVYLPGGTWLSAIAADGDGVLVARHGDHVMTRIDETMRDAGTIDLPGNWTDIRGIAVLGDRILAGGPAGLGAFDRSGSQLATSATTVAYASLRPAGPDRVAMVPVSIGANVATLFDPHLAATGTITLPMEPIRDNSANQRLVAATNWNDHVWYSEWGNDQPVYVVDVPLPSPP
jgi:hypothetical protein